MTFFLFANRGHGTLVARELRPNLIGICSRPSPPLWKRVGGVVKNWPWRDPFVLRSPPTGARVLPSKDLEAVYEFLRANRPTVIVCCGFHRLIPTKILECATLMAVNIHAGLLPQRGGGTPNRRAIREGDKETGVTVHRMTAEFDAGEIVWQKRVPIPEGIQWGALELSLSPVIRKAAAWIAEQGDEKNANAIGRSNPKLIPEPVQLQPSYHGEPFRNQPPEECRRICRATLPKMCGFQLETCGRRHCGL